MTVVEARWVRRRAYRTDKDDGVDLADAVIAELGRGAGCSHTVTFDRRAATAGLMQFV